MFSEKIIISIILIIAISLIFIIPLGYSANFNENTTIINNTCYGYMNNLKSTATQCIAHDNYSTDIAQNVNFSLIGDKPVDISLIFIFDNELDSYSAYHLGISGKMMLEIYLWNVTSYALTDRIPTSGDSLNPHLVYNITREEVLDGKLHNFSVVYGVDIIRDLRGKVETNTVMIGWTEENEKWIDITGNVTYINETILGRNYYVYYIQNMTFYPGQLEQYRIVYTPHNNQKQGRWHIIGYNSSMSLQDAIQNNDYFHMEAGWDDNKEEKQSQ